MPAMPHTLRDRCPECLGLLAVEPREYSADDDVVQCEYRCPTCGHVWVTRWAAAVLGGGAAA